MAKKQKIEETNQEIEQKVINTEKHNVNLQKLEENIVLDSTNTLFDLNQKLLSIDSLISYYLNTAKANEGQYTHNTDPIYQYAMKKIKQLELKKIEVLKKMEKLILG